jgi:hypothetical protein
VRQQNRFKLCKGKHSIVGLEGVVWCPTTENKTWFARRKGKTYFTGNSGWGGEDHAAMRAMDVLYGPHKTLPGQVLHIWHPQLSPEGIKDWVHWKERMWEGQADPQINNKLSWRYYHAMQCHYTTGKSQVMRKLVDESRKIPRNTGTAAMPNDTHRQSA